MSCCLLQVRASCDSAERELQAALAEKQHLQQELSALNDQLMLMQSELKLKSSRLEAATQQMAAADAEHSAEQGMLQGQLQELQVGSFGSGMLSGYFVVLSAFIEQILQSTVSCTVLVTLLCSYHSAHSSWIVHDHNASRAFFHRYVTCCV
jgi:hypothetical protein